MNATEDRIAPTSRRRLTVADFRRMAEAGIFHVNERVELLDGELVDMAPIGPRHADIVNVIVKIITRALDRTGRGEEHLLTAQNPVQLDRYSEVYPDAAVVRYRRYSDANPKPEDVLLIIEVSDSTLAYDRDVKIPAYAARGIQEAWIINIQDRCAEVYRTPRPQERCYRDAERIRDGAISMQNHPEVSLSLSELFPSPGTETA